MNRRRFLVSVGGALVPTALAGCSTSVRSETESGGPGTDTPVSNTGTDSSGASAETDAPDTDSGPPTADSGSGAADTGSGSVATETKVRNVPSDQQTEVASDSVTETSSSAISVTELTYHSAGAKGAVIAGDMENEGDRQFERVTLEATLYDENDTSDGLLDSDEKQVSTEAVKPGEDWQWAVTFREVTVAEVDYYSVTARGHYA